MRIASYKYQGREFIGLISLDMTRVLPLQEGEQTLLGSSHLPNHMLALIILGSDFVNLLLSDLQKAWEDNSSPLELDLNEVTLLAPIARPHKNIFCIGKNYQDHIQEMNAALTGDAPTVPIVFTKAPTCVIGPNEKISSHSEITQAVDYEGELLLVIGRKGINIPKEKAMDYVFGYTAFNDVTARDRQKKHQQWFLGKSMDTFGPMGPWIVTPDEMPPFGETQIISRVNGEVRQSAFLSDLIFDIPTIIATISEGLTLEPGDLIATGTPAGVGAGFTPPRFLKKGDRVDVEITGIGKLINEVE